MPAKFAWGTVKHTPGASSPLTPQPAIGPSGPGCSHWGRPTRPRVGPSRTKTSKTLEASSPHLAVYGPLSARAGHCTSSELLRCRFGGFEDFGRGAGAGRWRTQGSWVTSEWPTIWTGSANVGRCRVLFQPTSSDRLFSYRGMLAYLEQDKKARSSPRVRIPMHRTPAPRI